MCGCTQYTKEEPIASLYLKLPCSSYCTRCFVFFQSFPCPSVTLQTSTIPLFAANLWKFKRMKRPCGWSTFSWSHKILLSFKREKLLNAADAIFLWNLGTESRCRLPDFVLLHMTRCELLTLICIFSSDQCRLPSKHHLQKKCSSKIQNCTEVSSWGWGKQMYAELTICRQGASWQYSGGGFLRAKNSPGAQRTLQESFLIPRRASVRRLTRARNHLHSYQSSS